MIKDIPVGWLCPQCKAIMAPAITMCFYCRPKIIIDEFIENKYQDNSSLNRKIKKVNE